MLAEGLHTCVQLGQAGGHGGAHLPCSLLLVSGGKQHLALHALQCGGLALTQLGQGVKQGRVAIGQGGGMLVPLMVQLVQQVIGQALQHVALLMLGLPLLTNQAALPRQQDNQQHHGRKKQRCGGKHKDIVHIRLLCKKARPGGRAKCYISRRPSSALERVTSSAYSRSLPTGTPWAMRVQRTPRGLSRRAI